MSCTFDDDGQLLPNALVNQTVDNVKVGKAIFLPNNQFHSYKVNHMSKEYYKSRSTNEEILDGESFILKIINQFTIKTVNLNCFKHYTGNKSVP